MGHHTVKELLVIVLVVKIAYPLLLRDVEGHLQGQGRFSRAGVAAQDGEIPRLHVDALIQSGDAPGEIGGPFPLGMAVQERLVALAEVRDSCAGLLTEQGGNLVRYGLGLVQTGSGC